MKVLLYYSLPLLIAAGLLRALYPIQDLSALTWINALFWGLLLAGGIPVFFKILGCLMCRGLSFLPVARWCKNAPCCLS